MTNETPLTKAINLMQGAIDLILAKDGDWKENHKQAKEKLDEARDILAAIPAEDETELPF